MSQVSTNQVQREAVLSKGRYDPETIKEQVVTIATASGVRPSDAAIFADALVDADLHGASSHGVSRLNIYIRRIRKGLIDPMAELKVDHQQGAALVIDANNGLGQVQAIKSLEMIIPVAKKMA